MLLVSARASRPARDSAVRDEWPELAGPNDERIDPPKDEKSLIKLSDLDEEHEKADGVSDIVFVGRTIATVAATGRGKRRWTKRAAEIQAGTSVKHQVASVSSHSIPPPETMSTLTTASNTTHVPDTTSQAAPIIAESTAIELSSTTVTTSTEPLVSVTRVDVSTSSIVPVSESQDKSTQSNVNTTVIIQSTTQLSSLMHGNADEYFADDASSSTSATDTNFDDETTIIIDEITEAPPIQHAEADSEHVNTSLQWPDELNPTSIPDTSARPFLTVSSVVAVGRALSQEESVPWPEAKSTKVIGTIIEDIHGPFSDGVSSVSTISPEVLTGNGIVAIVMCISLVLVTTAGESKIQFLHNVQ